MNLRLAISYLILLLVSGTINAASSTYQLSYDAANRVQEIRLNNSNLANYQHEPNGSLQKVKLSGTYPVDEEPIIELSTDKLDFSQQKTNTQRTKTISISNKGNQSLNITLGPSPSSFLVVNNCQNTLAFGDTCQIAITFFPTSEQNYTGSLAINSNAKNGQQLLTLQGKGSTTDEPLEITDASGVDNASNVSVAGNLTLTLGQELEEGSCFADIQIKDSVGNLVDANASISGSSLVVDPSGSLGVNQTYSLVVPDCAVQSTEGHLLSAGLSYVFSTGNSPYGSPVKAIAAGDGHVLAVREDGTVWAWGDNGYGQLGNGTTIGSSVPIQVIGTGGNGHLNGISKLFAFEKNSFAVSGTGEAKSWGNNYNGMTGTSTSYQQNKEVFFPRHAQSSVIDVLVPSKVRGIYSHFVTNVGSDNFHGLYQSTSSGELKNMYRTVKDEMDFDLNTPLKSMVLDWHHNLYIVNMDGTVRGKICKFNFTCSYDYRNIPNLSDIKKVFRWDKTNYISIFYAVSEAGDVFSWLGGTSRYVTTFPTDNNRWENLPQKLSNLSGVSKISSSSTHVLALKKDGSIWGVG